MDMHATVSGRSWLSTCVPGLPCRLCRLGAASEVPPSCPSIKVGLPDWADPALLQPRQRPSGLGAWRRRHEDIHLRNAWGCRSLILISACAALGLRKKLIPCKSVRMAAIRGVCQPRCMRRMCYPSPCGSLVFFVCSSFWLEKASCFHAQPLNGWFTVAVAASRQEAIVCIFQFVLQANTRQNMGPTDAAMHELQDCIFHLTCAGGRQPLLEVQLSIGVVEPNIAGGRSCRGSFRVAERLRVAFQVHPCDMTHPHHIHPAAAQCAYANLCLWHLQPIKPPSFWLRVKRDTQ